MSDLHDVTIESVGVKTFGGQFNFELAAFHVQVEDAITGVMKDPILPGVGSVAAHVEENGVADQVGLGANEVRHGALCLMNLI